MFEAGLEQYLEAFHVMSALPLAQVVAELRETLLTQLMTHLLTAKQFGEIIQLAKSPLAKPEGGRPMKRTCLVCSFCLGSIALTTPAAAQASGVPDLTDFLATLPPPKER